MLRPLTIMDHAGNRVPLWQGLNTTDLKRMLGKNEYRSFRRLQQSEMQDEFREALGPTRHHFFGFRLSTYTLVVALFILAAVFSEPYLVWWMRWTLIAVGAGCIGGFAGWAFGRRLRKLGPRTRYVRHMLDRTRCPACLYDLNSTPPNANEHLVCPECGALWSIRKAAIESRPLI